MNKVIKFIAVVLGFLPFGLEAQTDITKGIHFELQKSWEEIKAEAKTEHKFIFVDCFATWCGPCKMMDRNVYPNDTVGQFLNARFISVKMQMDTSKLDNEQIKERYADAHTIMQEYKVNAFPTFLFFSPDGRIVHRGLGGLTVKGFIDLATDARDPGKQYYTLLEDYNHGKRDYSKMIMLADMANILGDQTISKRVTDDYARNYLPKLKDEELFTKDNLLFFGSNVILFNYNDRLFQYIKNHQIEADSLVHNPTYAKQVITIMINVQELFNKLWKDPKTATPFTTNPDWEQLKSNIINRYGYHEHDAVKLVLPTQISFYGAVKNWIFYAHYIEITMQRYPPNPVSKGFTQAMGGPSIFVMDDAAGLNSAAWTLFQNCKDKALLQKALAWSELSLKIAPKNDLWYIAQYYDTKANLFYKLNKTSEAIACEKQAIEALRTDKKSLETNSALDDPEIKKFQETIDTIEKGQRPGR